MAAVVTDQFRISNAGNFVDSVLNTSNSYYVFLGLPNPGNAGFGRTTSESLWDTNTRYDMYRHDYDIENPAPNSNTSRLYDANYYVLNSDFRVYICISNGSSGSSLKGGVSKDEPTFTDLEPSAAGTSGDGYVWKYLFTVSPSDIIKFDSTEYVVVPNDWSTSTDTQIQNVREAGDSTVNLNQLKKIYIEDGGSGAFYIFLKKN